MSRAWDHLPRTEPPTAGLVAVLRTLWTAKHTGPVTVHFAQGRPVVVEIPVAPQRITLDSAPRVRVG